MIKRYRMTEAQLQKVFEVLEKKRISEMDNFNYPTGSDTGDAPWREKEQTTTAPKKVDGKYTLMFFDGSEYLFKNTETNQLIYTQDDNWDEAGNNKWYDIKDALVDYLVIPTEIEQDEDGSSSVYIEDWKDYITSEDIANALVSYLNQNDAEIVDADDWSSGIGKFVLLTPETVEDVIYKSDVKQKALNLLSQG